MPDVPAAAVPPGDPFAPRPLPPGEIHVWRADLDARTPDEAVLSPEEWTRAARMRGKARPRFVRSRELLRRLLSAYGAGPPRALRIGLGAEGKPHLEAGGVRFSLAHTAGLWLAAFASDRDVGVDVERTARDVDPDRVASRIFAPGEVEALRRLPREAKIAGFFRAWTVREALVKVQGTGMFTFAAKVEVDVDPSRPASVRALDGGAGFWVAEVPVPPGHAAAVAAAAAPDAVAAFAVG